jgi:hypothetical protein
MHIDGYNIYLCTKMVMKKLQDATQTGMMMCVLDIEQDMKPDG